MSISHSHCGTQSSFTKRTWRIWGNRVQWLAERIGRHGAERGSWHWMLEELDLRQKNMSYTYLCSDGLSGAFKSNGARRLSAKLAA